MRPPDRLWVPAVAALALALVLAEALLVRADGDVSLLVHAGPPWTDAAGAPGSLTVQGTDEGFDGQFFYRLGTAPWSIATTESGVTFDWPALRNARWGYGALAWVVSGADPDLVPWALLAINVMAAAAVGGLGGALAKSCGRHAVWGIAFVLWPGFAYSLSLDTSELMAGALVLAGLLALRRRQWAPAALALVAAVLTRDTTLVVPAGIVAAGAWRLVARRHQGADAEGTAWLTVGTVPCVVFVGWQAVQWARFGDLPLTSSGSNNLAGPFVGLVDQMGRLLPPDGAAEAFGLLATVGLLALVGTAAWLVVRARPWRPDPELLAWAGSVLVVVVLNAYLWSGATAFLRASTEAGLLSTMLVLRWAAPLLLRFTTAGLGGLWLLTAASQVAKLG